MKTYCVNFKKNTPNENLSLRKTKQMHLSSCDVYGKKK